MFDKLAPILVSVYNRYECLVRCIESLKNNELAKHSNLFIISDAPACIKDKNEIDSDI